MKIKQRPATALHTNTSSEIAEDIARDFTSQGFEVVLVTRRKQLLARLAENMGFIDIFVGKHA